MRSLLRSILVTIASIMLLSWLLPQVSVANTVTLLLAGVVLALLNTLLRPMLKLVFLPINVLTLGIFGWLINVGMIYVAMWLVPGFAISPITILEISLNEFWSVALVSFLMSVLGSFLHTLI